MNYIKAPFNFVPVSDKVYYPDWAEKISHDVPFSDGLSGTLSLTIEAKTPIFIRDSEKKTEFCHIVNPEGKIEYFIPGTSIKGMVRNVLEIMGFAKLSMDEKMRFSTREWDKPYIYDLKTLEEQRKVECGWLRKINGNILIIGCGKPKRINHKRIDEWLGNQPLESKFKRDSGIDLNQEQTINGQKFDPKTAAYKYALSGKKLSEFQNLKFEYDSEYCNKYNKNRVKISNKPNAEKGALVFTGQPDNWECPRQQRAGKFYEFVFIDHSDSEEYQITPDHFEKFEYLHRNSDDWKFWRKELGKQDSKGIPVFFRKEGNTVEGFTVKDFGLSFLYRVPFQYSPKEINDSYQNIKADSKPDLAQCIFGHIGTNNNNERALRGRVQFTPAKPVNKPKPYDEVIKTTLGSPQASYYPIYIVQSPVRSNSFEYKTYNNKDAQLKWKRYPVRNKATSLPPSDNNDINTEFRPLNPGVQFKSDIRFHNLRPIELGALLSAISFHNNENDLFHSIGMGKPMGYGKVKIDYTLDNNILENSNFYMAQFERAMNVFLGKEWIKTDQIKELFTMAWDKQQLLKKVNLNYMQMSTDRNENHFAKAKEFNEYLEFYTKLSNTSFEAASISEHFDKIDKKMFNDLLQEAQNLKEKNNLGNAIIKVKEALTIIPEDSEGLRILTLYEREKEFINLKKNGDELLKDGHFKEAREKFEQAKKLTDQPNILDPLIAECTVEALKQENLESVLNKEGDFKTNINRINKYLKKRKISILNEEDCSILIDMVEVWIARGKDTQSKREWAKTLETSQYWKQITNWIGKEAAKKSYEHLVIKKQK